MPQSTQPSFLLSCCTNMSYFIVVTCLIFGFFITNEQFSFIREEKRQLDFIKVPVNDKSDYNILFVHGAFGNKEEWMHNYFPYFQTVNNPKIKSIGAFSLTGHGKSSHSEYIRFLRLHDFVNDLKTIINENYQNEKVILACHSLGGLICQKYLEVISIENNPKVDIRSLILLTSMPPIHRFDNILPPMLFDLSVVVDMVLTLRLDPLISKTSRHTKHFLYHEKTTEQQVHEISKHVKLDQEGIIFYLDSLTSSLNPTPIMDYYSNRKLDISIISIEKDSFFKTSQHEKSVEFWKLVLNSKPYHHIHSELIPNTVQVGHQLMLDQEWQVVAKKINQFILDLTE